MESGALEADNTAAPGEASVCQVEYLPNQIDDFIAVLLTDLHNRSSGPRGPAECNIACMKRLAWAKSRDSLWQESGQEHSAPQRGQQSQGNEDAQKPSEPGQVPNKITSWLIECRTPLGASLDDQSASPSRGVLKNGCSFEDDLSLGAEANYLQSTSSKTESCFSLVAEEKRSQFKERGRSMNSTGSGKSSTVSSVSEVLEQSKEHPEEILLTLRVSELLDLYEEDPEEILLNLGFGQEEPDLASKVPNRFFNSSSSARGIDIKVYLAAQMQRMELENPNYALTSRFRQIEVLTTVANEFFQLYSQVSGQPVQRISTREQGGEEGEEGADSSPPPLKRTSSARNVAKLLKKTLTKHNLLAASSESPDTHTPNQHTQLNGHSPLDHTHGNGNTGPEQNSCSSDPDHQGDIVSPKHSRKKDNCPLATVTEETNGDGETDRLTNESPEKSSTGPAAKREQQTISADLQLTNEGTVERTQVVKEEEEKNLPSNPEKPPCSLAPPQLAQLLIENTGSFDMEEIQSNEDEMLPVRSSRANDLSRTVSQQSDSSGFAEEPSADANSSLKVQESSDSCDSETTVTSHPSQDLATPVATDQLVFELPDCREVEVSHGGAAEAEWKNSSRVENEHDGNLEQVPQYTSHQLPRNSPVGPQQQDTAAKKRVESEDRTNSELESEMESSTPSMSAKNQEAQHTQIQTEIAPSTEPPTERVGVMDKAQEGQAVLKDSGLVCPPAPSSPVLSALQRAKQVQMSWTGQGRDQQLGEVSKTLGRGRGRRGIPMQRSSSLPTSLLSPSRVVSSVRIQFGRGQASCTQPRYSFKYTPESGVDNEEKGEEDGEEEVDGQEQQEETQTSCLSTVIINPASSSGSNSKPARLSTQPPIPPKPIPRHLMQSTCSLESSSPPPDWSIGGRSHSWSTQSVPDLTYNRQLPGHLEQNMRGKQNQQSWNPGQVIFPYPSPNPAAQYVNLSPSASPSLNPNPYTYTVNTPPQYPSPLQPYASLPNLHDHYSPSHHSSLTSLHHPATPTISQHGSLTNLLQPSTSTTPHHVGVGNPHPGSPMMHYHGYSYPQSHHSPYYAAPHVSPFASPYLGYHGYTMSPHPAFPHPISQCPPLAPEHSLVQGLTPPAPGFFPGMGTAFGPGHNLHPGLTPPAAPVPISNQGPSSTEMQLRRVLHDIRGTVQSLNQNRSDTPDTLSEHRATFPSHQSLAEFQQKRRSLNVFRSQMMDLEMSIIRQQAMVYKHLSPGDRLEMEQLQSLRSAVREELQELEQQLEDRLLELTHHTQHRSLHRDSSLDSLSTASALRAMEPVSDLLREQLFLQSELSYDGNTPSTNLSSRSSSPGRGERGDSEQRQGTYRASINITPTLPRRPNTQTEEGKEEEAERDGEGGRVDTEVSEETGAAGGGLRVGNLQHLLREIRESVAQEVRQEIYSELLAAVSPRRSPLPTRQQPL
ncbi:protein ITPRID2 isoform X2 [Channa argus]|uniref:protein ITPRID2 isoform X2 n=1 Tax=Channa argus TaxID=215402 RepID=UPI003520E4A1